MPILTFGIVNVCAGKPVNTRSHSLEQVKRLLLHEIYGCGSCAAKLATENKLERLALRGMVDTVQAQPRTKMKKV